MNVLNDIELLKNFRSPAFPGSYFLSFEGIEGAGKSSQIARTVEYLEERGYRVLVLREPGGTSFGEKLRKAILETKVDLHPVSEINLFASSRSQLLSEVVLKELAVPNTIIICDRYIDSSLAYQGMARGLGFDYILNLHSIFPLNLMPHLTIYLRIDLETSMKRQKIRNAPKDYFEAQGHDFYNNLIAGYDECAKLFNERVKIVDGSDSMETVYMGIKKLIDQVIVNSNDASSEQI